MKKYVMAAALAVVLGTTAFGSAQAVQAGSQGYGREAISPARVIHEKNIISLLVTPDRVVKLKDGKTTARFLLFKTDADLKKYQTLNAGARSTWPYIGECWSEFLQAPYPCLYNW